MKWNIHRKLIWNRFLVSNRAHDKVISRSCDNFKIKVIFTLIVLRSFSRFGSIWIQKNVQYGRSFLIYLTTSFNPSARFLRFLRIFLSESSIAYENLEPTSLKTLLVPKSLLDSPGFKIFLSFNISRNFIVISLSIG